MARVRRDNDQRYLLKADDTVVKVGDDGKIDAGLLPALALTEVFVVANEAERLALDAQEGDVAIQQDNNVTYIHNGGTAGTNADWNIIEAPANETDPVFTASPAAGIASSDINNWNTAYSWGDHAAAGYGQASDDHWSISGTSVYYNGGRVGIGTDSPGSVLHTKAAGTNITRVESTSVSACYTQFLNTNGSWYSGTTGSGDYQIYDLNAGLPRLRIDSGGDVGIGTSSPHSSGAYRVLEVKSSHPDAAGYLRLSNTTAGEHADIFNFGNSLYHRNDGQVIFQDASSNNRMRLIGDRLVVGDSSTDTSTCALSVFDNGNTASSIARMGFNGRAAFGYDGTRGAVHIGDNPTGSSTTKSIVFDSGGSERMRVQTGGQLLVGQTSSTSTNFKLDVGGFAAATRLYLKTDNNNDAGTFFYADVGGRIRTDNDFYVGTSSANTYLYSTNTYLGFTSGDNILLRGNTLTSDRMTHNGSSGFTQIDTTGTDFVLTDTTNAGGITNYLWRDHSAGKLYLGTADDAVEIRGGQTVSLGSSALTTSGSVQANDLRTNRYVYDRDSTTNYLDFQVATNTGRLVAGGSEAFRWGANYLRLQDSYTLRFGSSNDYRVYWDGPNNDQIFRGYTHGADTFFQQEDSGGTNRNVLRLGGPTPKVYLYYNSSVRLETTSAGVSVTGALTASGDVTAFSDERLKSNIKTLDGSKVYEMRGVSYEKDGELSSGVVAQELEKVAPELVHDGEEYKSVAYGNLVGYLIEAVKDLKAEIEELKNGTSN